MADKTKQGATAQWLDEGLVAIDQVLSVVPISRRTWYNGIKAGKYPKPVKLGRLNAWRVSDIRQMLADLA